MEQHPVPQHIASYEFRLVGDMTLKQFLQVAGGGLVALLFYASPLPGIIKWPLILFSGLTGTALAFLPFEERPLSIWIVAFIKAIYSPTKYLKGEGVTGEIFAPELPGQAQGDFEPAVTIPGGEIISQFEEKEQSFFQKVLSLFPHVPTVQIRQQEEKPTSEEPTPRPKMVVEEESLPVNIGPTLVGSKTEGAQAKFAISAAPPAPPNIPNVVAGQVIDDGGNFVEGAILEIRDSEGRPTRAIRTNKVGHFFTATPLQGGVYEVITERPGFQFTPIKFTATNDLIAPLQITGKKIDDSPPPPPGGKKLSYPA